MTDYKMKKLNKHENAYIKLKSEVTIMDGHDSPRIGSNDIDYKPTKLLSAFLKGTCAIVC